MSANPIFFVNGPPPVPPKYRLLDTVRVVTPDDPRWQNGVRVWGYPSDVPVTWDPCSDGTFRTKDDGTPPPTPEFGAYVVNVGESCSTFSIHNQEEFQQRAASILRAGVSYAIEKELATGNTMGNAYPALKDTNATILNGGTAVGSKTALAMLEDAIAGSGRAGVILATPGTVSAWGEFRLNEQDGRLVTTVGTPVAAAGGLIGVVPDDSPAALGEGEAWAWATGPISVFLGNPYLLPDNIKQALDRENNVITYRAEQSAVAYWDTSLQVAVKVDWTS